MALASPEVEAGLTASFRERVLERAMRIGFPEPATRRAVSLRVANGEALTGKKAEDRRDLSSCKDPSRMSRIEAVEEILRPAFNSRWLRYKSERQFELRLQNLTDEQVREWASETLKSHPWAPGFHVPTFYEFVTSEAYLDESEPTERQLRAFHDSIGPDAWHWFVYPRKINTIWLCWGKGSGKDWLSACVLAYVAYVVVNMRNPWFHFGTIPGEAMDCINVAENGVQAKDVYFVKLQRMLERDCFTPILDQRTGKHIKSDKVIFWKRVPGRQNPIRALRLLSLNSKAESVEGKNTFFWVMDEADAFRTKDGDANARDMFGKLSTSNRFRDRQIGIVISYPRAKNGFILTHLKECGNLGGARLSWWGDKAPTYGVLPFKTFIPTTAPGFDPLNPGRIIMRERWTNPDGTAINDTPDTIIYDKWLHDKETYNAVYECNPPSVEDAFISNETKISDATTAYKDACMEPIASVETFHTSETSHGRTFRYVAKRLKNLRLRPNTVYYIGSDGGHKQDSFTLTVFHGIPSGERGYLCPECWIDRRKRYQKHYFPRAVGGEKPETLSAWACDCCGNLPTKMHAFWGVASSSGREVTREVIRGYSKAGDPIYEQEEYTDEKGRRQQRQKTETVHLPVVVEDLIIEWEPDRNQGIEVDFENVTDVIIELVKTGQIGHITIDQWQAEEKAQRIRRAGGNVDTKQLSNPEQLKMYRNYKDVLYRNICLLQENPKRDIQLSELQFDANRIDHPTQHSDGTRGGKDITDAEAMAILDCCTRGTSMGRVMIGGRDSSDMLMREQGKHTNKARQARASLVGGVIGRIPRPVPPRPR